MYANHQELSFTVFSAKILARGGDPDAKKKLDQELQGVHAKIKDLRPQMEDAEKKKAGLEREGQVRIKILHCWLECAFALAKRQIFAFPTSQIVSERFSKAKATKENYNRYRQKLSQAKQKLRDAEEDLGTDDRSKKTELLKKIKKLVSGSVSALESHASSHDKLMEYTFSNAGTRIDRDSVTYLLRKVS